jgi:hypothetical protein
VVHDLIHLNSKICVPEFLFVVVTNSKLVFVNSETPVPEIPYNILKTSALVFLNSGA